MIKIIDTQFLRENASLFGFSLSEIVLKKLSLYADFLIEYNKKVNLTAIVKPDEIAIKHFIDSMMLLNYIDIKSNQLIADIGTGAGFPGVVLKVLREDIEVHLVDSLNKRIIFLDELIKKLSLMGIYTHHNRIEDFAKENREKFDFVTNRAFSNMSFIIESCIPILKVDGILCPLRGKFSEEDLAITKRASNVINSKFINVQNYNLLDYGERNIVFIKKISHTSLKYPRLYSKMTKSPI